MRCTLEFVRPLPVCHTVWPNDRQRFGRRRHIRFNGDSDLGAGCGPRAAMKSPGQTGGGQGGDPVNLSGELNRYPIRPER
jgi:hypothetical protein